MSQEKHQKIKQILSQVLQVAKENQQQLLNVLCGSDMDLKAAVEKLLSFNDTKNSNLLEVPAIQSQFPEVDLEAHEAEMPTQIKQYKILKKIGSGGMGDVYLALQSYPAERQVAIKVLKQLPNQQRLFEETQILAKLNHPNIATFHDVNTTDDGQVFIVMELIEGEDIVQWCEYHKYDLKKKIKLFQQLCAGISYAHEKGIIHCDIKPYNVQVTQINNEAVVKIIDFGISQYENKQSKAGEISGTPAYLAPEVLNNHDKNITDTRRDVYALGVLLDKLLRKESTKDLTAIIEKARNPEKLQRYANAISLNDDLQRYLDKRIVKARTRTTPYVLSRFVQRNMGLVVFTVVLLVTLIGGYIAQSIQAHKAETQAKIAIKQSEKAKLAQKEAEELTGFLVDLFNLSNPERANKKVITTDELINKANDKLLAIEKPTLSDARFMHTIGSIYTRMDDLEKAKTIIEKSLLIKQTKLNANDDEIISDITQLGLIHRRLKNNDLAEKYLIKAIELNESKDKPNLSQLAYTHNHLGNLYWQDDNIEASVQHHTQALKLRKQTGEKKLLADSYNNLGAIYKKSKQWDLSKQNLDKALELYREVYDENHPYIAFALNNLANVEEHRFNWDVAENLYKSTYLKLTAIYGKSHQNTLIAQINLAIFYARRMRYQESNELRKQGIAIYLEKGDKEQVAKQFNRMAYNIYYLGNFKQAQKHHSQALLAIKGIKTKDAFLKAKLNIDFADLMIEHGDLELAKTTLNRSINTLKTHTNKKYFYRLIVLNLLAKIDLKQHNYQQASEKYHQILQLSDDQHKQNQREIIFAYLGLAKINLQNINYIDTQKNLQKALKIAQINYGEKHPLIAAVLFEMGQLQLSQNKTSAAKEYFQKALTMQKIVLPAQHKDLIKTQKILSQL